MDIAVKTVLALKNLPPFPPVAIKALELLASESVVLEQVASVLRTDAALSAEVLRLANSALLGGRRHLDTISRALVFLGTQRVSSLLYTLSISRLLRRAGARESIYRSWHHNLACALASKKFASSFGKDPDEGYNAGLFHDLGRLAFVVAQPELYDELIHQDGDLRSLEREYFGMDHCEAGAWLIEHWKLPHVFIDVALNHHAPKSDDDELTMLVHASCVVADRLGFGVARRQCEQSEGDGDDALGLSIREQIQAVASEYGI